MASIYAAKAGKDIYCEKPCSMTIAESQALADTMRRYGRIYQAGTQRRSIANFIFAADLCPQRQARQAHRGARQHAAPGHAATTGCPAEPEPAKDEVDWDLWLGPCPWRPYNQQYVDGGWRGFFDFHGGGILEWGAHTVDLCQWAGADDTGPVLYEPQPAGCIATYANGVKLVMRDTGWMGLGTCSVRYEGEDGWVETGDSGRVEFSSGIRAEQGVFDEAGTSAVSHVRNFLECVKTRARPTRTPTWPPEPHHLPCGLHRLAAWPELEVRPGQGRVHRRRRGQPHAVARAARAVADLNARFQA